MRSLATTAGRVTVAAGGAITLLATLAASASAQMPAMLPADPDMPVKDGFDTGRAIFWEHPNFQPLRDPEWISLRDAIRRGDVSEDTPVVTFEAGGVTHTLVSSQMTYHHVAQGETAGEPWMVTF